MMNWKNRKFTLRMNEAHYIKGVKRLREEFDVISLFRTLRHVDHLSKILLARHQEHFLPVLKENVLSADPDEFEELRNYNSDLSSEEEGEKHEMTTEKETLTKEYLNVLLKNERLSILDKNVLQ